MLHIVLATRGYKKPQLRYASTKLLLAAASDLTKSFSKAVFKDGMDIEVPLAFLKESWSLAGKVSKDVNQLSKPIRGDIIKT